MVLGGSRRRRQRQRGGGAVGPDGTPVDPLPTSSTFSQFARKLLIYGAVFAAVQWNKRRNGGMTTDKESKKSTDNESAGIQIGVPGPIRRFGIDEGVEVVVVQNFLPLDLATQWRREMAKEWYKARNGAWQYVTFYGGERKVGDLDADERNVTAHKMRMNEDMGPTCSLWEFPPDLSFHQSLGLHFSNESVHGLIESLVSDDDDGSAGGAKPKDEQEEFPSEVDRKVLTLSKVYAAHFTTGDFITGAPKTAPGENIGFLLFLTHSDFPGEGRLEWEDDYDGQVRFKCAEDGSAGQSFCQSVRPSFNTAILFRTRGKIPSYEVPPVSWRAESDGFRNFILMGRYTVSEASSTPTVPTDSTGEDVKVDKEL